MSTSVLVSSFLPSESTLFHSKIPRSEASLFSKSFHPTIPSRKKKTPLSQRFSDQRFNCRAETEITNSVDFSSPPKVEGNLEKDGLVFSTNGEGLWDSSGIGGAVVKRYVSDNDERWCVWYQGWNDSEGISSISISSEETLSGTTNESSGSESLNSRLPSASAGLALSSNGLHWKRCTEYVEDEKLGSKAEGLVMQPNPDWWTFDTRDVNVSDILIMSSHKVRASSGVYWMYYAGGTLEEVSLPEKLTEVASALGPGLGLELGSGLGLENGGKGSETTGKIVEGLRRRPGLAMSNDGRNWARIEGDHHSGALFDLGEEGEWDSLFIDAPQVVFHEAGDIRMHYHSFDVKTGRFEVGLARSRDGIKWVKQGKCVFSGPRPSFEAMGIGARQVIPSPEGKEGSYIMFYEGISAEGKKSIGLAKSSNGLWEWERVGEGPILSPSEEEGFWDNWSIGSPSIVEMGDGKWRLYYVGEGKDGVRALGMAENVGEGLTSFRKWRNTFNDLNC